MALHDSTASYENAIRACREAKRRLRPRVDSRQQDPQAAVLWDLAVAIESLAAGLLADTRGRRPTGADARTAAAQPGGRRP